MATGANLSTNLGLKTRRNSGLEEDLTVETQVNSEGTQLSTETNKPKRRSVLGRKRSYNDLKKAQTIPSG